MTADIIEFRIRPDRKPQDAVVVQTIGQIIIFPGVRFERLKAKRPSPLATRRTTAGSVAALAPDEVVENEPHTE